MLALLLTGALLAQGLEGQQPAGARTLCECSATFC
jgi:hypothetical protein